MMKKKRNACAESHCVAVSGTCHYSSTDTISSSAATIFTSTSLLHHHHHHHQVAHRCLVTSSLFCPCTADDHPSVGRPVRSSANHRQNRMQRRYTQRTEERHLRERQHRTDTRCLVCSHRSSYVELTLQTALSSSAPPPHP